MASDKKDTAHESTEGTMGDPISRRSFIRWGATELGVAATLPLFGGEADVTQTMVQVAVLAMPELKVEIKCIAWL